MTATTFLFGAGTHGVRPSSGAARPSMFGGFPHEAFPDLDAHGVVILDRLVSEAKSRTVALALSEERLRFTQEAGRIGSWTLDLATMSLESSDGCKANFGRNPGADFTYEAWIEGVHPDDRARMRDAISSAIAGQTHYDHEYRITYPDGAVHWIHARGHASYQPDGRPLTIAGISLDITDRRRAEAHRDLLAKELAHRVKNTLATVQSIIRQTLRRSASLEEAEAILDARIMALAAAHDVLIRDTWEGATLNEVVGVALRPFGADQEGRFTCSGPNVHLASRVALAFAMALHELATNAVKYGALSTEIGTVLLTWDILDGEGMEQLRFQWEEAGGPAVVPPTRAGFGSRMIERALAVEISGSAEIDYRLSGIHFTATAPLSEILRGG
ncbi:PAS domain-containing protein [Methylobacterium sp. SD274]|uniref:sensor histidine kinase n=1 Tax=Methylobacterium sp. SD274 TaxID=2782009 RepID=UPI001A967004|nr:sensor histidine kinase [Methylobacterium sp. SD274]MBO1021923.1 PAS domain-containing protein [Methylobacterium sp. SD274]